MRETRLAAIAQAKSEIERRAAERLMHEAEYGAKLASRQKKARDCGKRPGGKPPQPPSGAVQAED